MKAECEIGIVSADENLHNLCIKKMKEAPNSEFNIEIVVLFFNNRLKSCQNLKIQQAILLMNQIEENVDANVLK